MAPRTFAERPKSPLVSPNSQPANDNDPVLGTWENGQFRFTSPEARQKWRRKSYEQGVGEDNWHLGKEMDAKSTAIVQSGLGGANSGHYQGPDGKYRLMTPKTIESQAARDHRNKYLTGKTIDQLAAAKAMPGVDEWVEQGEVARAKIAQGAANNNAVEKPLTVLAQQVAGPPSDAAQPPSLKSFPPKDQQAGQMLAGRFGAMKSALESSDKQSADDIGRIAVNAVLGNYGDEARAAVTSIGSWWDGKSFGETYDSKLQAEKAETLAAQERQGLVGTGIEIATGFIPLVGDISGALADFKDWKENGDDWGWKDYGLVALGPVPGAPNRSTVKGAKKIGDELLDSVSEVGDQIADLGKKTSKVDEAAELAKVNYRAMLDEAKSKVYSEGDARKLSRSTRGIIYVEEKAGGPAAAKEFMKTHPDVIYDAERDVFHVPAIYYDNPNSNGYPFIKLDAASVFGDNTGLVLTDVKTKMAIWSKETQRKARDTLNRLRIAAEQNPDLKLHYQFESAKAAEAAQSFIDANGFGSLVFVTVRE